MKRFANKTLLLTTFILLISLVLPVTALAGGKAGGTEFTQTVNGYQVTLVLDKPAFVGENDIHVLVKDGMGMPVPQADLEVSVGEAQTEHTEEVQPTAEAGTMSGMSNMDAQPTAETGSMSGMGSMDAKPTEESGTTSGASNMDEAPAQSHDQMGMIALAAGHESGEYDGRVSIESAGDVTIRVHLTVSGELMEADFPLHVAKSNSGAIVLGSFFAVNVALISAAVILKPKSVSATLSKKA